MGRRRALLLVVAFMVVGSAYAKFQMHSATVSGRNYVSLRDVAAFFGMEYRCSRGKASLRSAKTGAVITVDEREAQVNRVTMHLSFAPVLHGAEPFITESDFRLVLDPVLRPLALPKVNPVRIMIDPGHGGGDQGTSGKMFREKQINLQIARRLQTELRRYGYTVGLTRTGDTELGLTQRSAIAKAFKADLFISVHANSTANRKIRGVETFVFNPQGTPSTYGSSVSKSAVGANRFDRLNVRLAYELHKALTAATGYADRGVKHAKFMVLREAPCPAVLVEVGFMSNPTEEQQLGTLAFQEKIVRGLAAGVLGYHWSCGRRK